MNMSYNLHLTANKDKAKCGLFQTPTVVTERALANSGVRAKEIYFAWLDSEVEESKPLIHPRSKHAKV